MKTWLVIVIALGVGILAFFLGAKFGGSITKSSTEQDA